MTYKELLITEFTNLILKEVKKYKKSLDIRGRKNKITYSKIINIFIMRLETNLTWSRLGDIYKISKSYIHNIYCKWSNFGIFKNAYNNFLNTYKNFINNNEAYIDTTSILNKYGYRITTGFNSYESKKHRCNKLSIISSKNGIPLGINIGKGNIHDINLLINTLPNKIKIKNLYADKSYNSTKFKNKLLLNKKINLIFPYKKNQINKNTINENNELKNRYKIEHVNNFIKQNRSLNYRYEKDILNFESLVYLGCLKLGLQIIINNFYKF